MKTKLYIRHTEPDETGSKITSEEQLLDLIDHAAECGPGVCHLECDNGYELVMGIGRPLGCVQHSALNGDLPYLMATTDEARHSGDGHVEFLYQYTPTPISVRYCLPLELIKKVAVHFLNTGERSDAVEWEPT